jgi:O-antigen/teichoic acid export membrane protein
MENSKKDFQSNVIVTGLTEGLNVVARFLLSIFLARKLGVEGRGEYALALLIPGIFMIFVYLGIGEATASILGKEKFPKEKIVGNLNFYILSVSILSFIIYNGFSSLILKLVKNNLSIELYRMSFFILPVTLTWGGYASVLLGLSSVKIIGWGRVINNFLFLCIFYVVAKFFKITSTIAVTIFLITSIIEIMFLIYFVSKKVAIKISFDLEIIKEQIKFGIKFFLGGLFNQENRRLDSFLINFFVGTYGLGIYSVAVSLTEILLNVSNIFSRVIFSSSAVSKNNENLPITTAAIRQNLFFMTVFAVILSFLLKPIILFLYSSKFIFSLQPALILLPGIVALGVSGVIGYSLTGYGKPEEVTKSAGIAFVFTLVLDLILIPKYGVNGAALASTIAYATSAFYLVWAYYKFSKISFREILVIQKQDIISYFKYKI